MNPSDPPADPPPNPSAEPPAEPPAGPPAEPAPPDQLPVKGFTGTPEEIERQWFEQVYKGRGDSMWQLTWRAVLMGSALGGFLSLTNIYIGLKTGWGFGVAITACILSYAIWTTFYRIGLVRTKMTVLENNCMQSTASSAGYSTGGTLVSAIAAYVLLTGKTIPTLELMAWIFFLAVMGVTMAIPMKRQMINIEQLRFPSGIAAAETLRALHSEGQRGLRAAKALLLALLFGGASKFFEEGFVAFARNPAIARWFNSTPDQLADKAAPLQIGYWMDKVNELIVTKAWMARTVAFTWDPIFIAAGVFTGVRACASMLIGGTLCWMVYVPYLQRAGLASGEGYTAFIDWTLWAGASCMVTSGLLSFGLQWRSALRAFRDLGKIFRFAGSHKRDALDQIETPMAWFAIGQLVGLTGLAFLAHRMFGMNPWLCVFAVLLSFPLALVACRVCGETDTTPVGAMGKITQLTFGAVAPKNANVNLMGACITAAAADSSSDLLTDLKSGYLLGAHPRKQFIAQFAGIFVGTLVSVFVFNLIASTGQIIGTESFPAPAARTWAAVAEALSGGLENLHTVKVWGIVLGGLVGLIVPLFEVAMPKQYRSYVPSAAALGLAWTIPWNLALLFFIGAVLGLVIEKTEPKVAEEYSFPVCAGIIAGSSLLGVAFIFIEFGPDMYAKLIGGG